MEIQSEKDHAMKDFFDILNFAAQRGFEISQMQCSEETIKILGRNRFFGPYCPVELIPREK
jgi:hypothetical protein